MTTAQAKVLLRANTNCISHRVITEHGQAWFMPLTGSLRGRRRIPERLFAQCIVHRWIKTWARFKDSDTTYWQVSSKGHSALARHTESP